MRIPGITIEDLKTSSLTSQGLDNKFLIKALITKPLEHVRKNLH